MEGEMGLTNNNDMRSTVICTGQAVLTLLAKSLVEQSVKKWSENRLRGLRARFIVSIDSITFPSFIACETINLTLGAMHRFRAAIFGAMRSLAANRGGEHRIYCDLQAHALY